MKFNIPKYLLDQGYIHYQKHPNKELYIYNYTNSVQYEKFWNEYTINARGIVLDKNNNIISKPFPKFFNFNELSIEKQKELLNKKYCIFEKMDGYFIQVFLYKNDIVVTSRGSFDSEYSKYAEEILWNKHSGFIDNVEPGKTYIFELIKPEKRIIVNYKDLDDLILLVVVDSLTGKTIDINSNYGFLKPKEYPYIDIKTLLQQNKENAEGYVLVFEDDYRVKIKFEDYVNLSRALSHLNEKVIWNILSNHKKINKLRETLPDELYDWVDNVIDNLNMQYNHIEKECFDFYNQNITNSMTPKEVAAVVKKYKHKSIIFAMFKNQKYEKIIWRKIKPKIYENSVGIGSKTK